MLSLCHPHVILNPNDFDCIRNSLLAVWVGTQLHFIFNVRIGAAICYLNEQGFRWHPFLFILPVQKLSGMLLDITILQTDILLSYYFNFSS